MVVLTFDVKGERLAEFYEACKSIDIRRGVGFPKIEQVFVLYYYFSIYFFRLTESKSPIFSPMMQPTPSFLTAMEEYVKDAPRSLVLLRAFQIQI